MNNTKSPTSPHYTAFAGEQMIASGDLSAVARATHPFATASPLIFDDATGQIVELDLRGSADDAVARLERSPPPLKATRGRPKLGVTAREVTLLPRHWEWLAGQPGGASATLRRLVDEARRDSGGAWRQRGARDALYRAMTTLAGDRPGYEEAARALFANNGARFATLTAAWPRDIAAYLAELSAGAWVTSSGT